MTMSSAIEPFGFDPETLEGVDPAALAGRKIARVVAVHRDSYLLGRGDGDVFAELEGKLRYGAASPVDLPAVGDWVIAAYYDSDTHAIIHQVLPRKSLLRRKTPGMRELGNFSVDTGLAETFEEITALAKNCRFADCTHDQETGCAVAAALAEGRLSEDRYRSYIKMSRESAFHEMSYLEKRKKDRAFGKMCRNIMKSKKNRR